VEESIPPRATEKVNGDRNNALELVHQTGGQVSFFRRVIGPIYDESAAFDQFHRQSAPKPTIVAVVSIVPHDEIVFLGNDELRQIIPARIDENPHLRLSRRMRVVNHRLFERLPIDEDLLVLDAHLLPWKCHHALDEISIRLHGKLENDDVVAADLASGGEQFVEGTCRGSVQHLVDEKVVSHE
jgi:hypothetical protein